jgi:hypothetical protein
VVLTRPDLFLVSGRIWTGRGEAEALGRSIARWPP